MDMNSAESLIVAMKLKGVSADKFRARADNDALQFFIVENTAKRRAFYLAGDANYARHLAASRGHVEDFRNARVFVPNDKFWIECPGFLGAVRRAIAARKPGLIEQRGQHAVMGDAVFAPIGEAQ